MITSWSMGSPSEGMDEAILVEFAQIIGRHPWWKARADLVRELLKSLGIVPPAALLEAGCGWGTNLTVLEHAGYAVTGLDVSRQALQMIDRPNRRLIEADLSKDLPENLPAFDCVLALDVIEHIDDDAHALRQLARLVRPGGHLIVTVPALPELYSEFDEVQGHRRRYTAAMLRACFAESELTLQRTLWWGQWMVRLFGSRKTRNRARSGEGKSDIYKRYLSIPPWPASLILRTAFWYDQRRALAGRNVTGTSLVAIATRPESLASRP